MPLRAELYCYFCGHGCGDVLVPTRARKPTPEQLRAAYATVAEPIAPVWDEAGQPNCPRCGGQLFLEKYGHEAVRRAERPLRRAS